MTSKIRLDDGTKPGALTDLVGVKGAAKIYESNDFWLEVGLGKITGMTIARGIGYNPDIDTSSTPEDCWGGSGLYPWLPGVTNLEMWCSNVNDTAAGTGARSVSFLTLDGNYKLSPQTVPTNGNTAVPIPNGALRNNGGRVILVGSGGTNAGDIHLRDAGGGTLRGIILAGKGVMRQAPYTVPAGFTLAVRQILLGVDSPTGSVNQFASMETLIRPLGQSSVSPLAIGNTNGAPYNHFAEPPIIIAEKSDFSLPVVRSSDVNIIVTAAWNGVLSKN